MRVKTDWRNHSARLPMAPHLTLALPALLNPLDLLLGTRLVLVWFLWWRRHMLFPLGLQATVRVGVAVVAVVAAVGRIGNLGCGRGWRTRQGRDRM